MQKQRSKQLKKVYEAFFKFPSCEAIWKAFSDIRQGYVPAFLPGRNKWNLNNRVYN